MTRGTPFPLHAAKTAAMVQELRRGPGVVILLDDVGFGQVSTFGGPVPTPANYLGNVPSEQNIEIIEY